MRVRIKWKRIIILAVCASVSYFWAAAIRAGAHDGTRANDFVNMYYGTRCFLEHKDLYNPQTVRAELKADGGRLPEMSAGEKAISGTWVMVQEYLPPAYLAMAPFGFLPRRVAQALWMVLIPLLMIVAGYLAWGLAPEAPVLAGCMAGFILLNSVVVMTVGNPAGIVLPFCVIAAWCFLKERYALAGVVLLAWSLAMKPHDAGLVWLYFVLAGGTGRKRALQTLGITAVLGICAALWIAPASPHWVGELHGQIAMISAHGGASDAGPTGLDNRGFSPIVSLQNTLAVFKDDAHFYNPVSYAIGGGLILAWMIAVLRKRRSREETLLALAAISILTMLPVYHHAEDAKLLLLAIPGCALLWAAGGARRWMALGSTAAAIFVTSDIPIVAMVAATGKVAISDSTIGGKVALLLVQPAPLVLLAAGCFYVCVLVRYRPAEARSGIDAAAVERAAGATA
ncbi:MAG TPA: glycosyltransferase family 87 protein [Terracidiphilus sp.]|nr:glycosyltransferase family 87 protein [Terracidiphilus sp.]